ncbi:hypothetical protein OF83DRAFT_1168199 [Amylostereum chailletii]|nr:hypothetical protein OF83DRAFT_1168199 [Amylostereum chailletii]
MAPTLQSALSNFTGSVYHVGLSIVQAFASLFGAFLAFGQALITTVLDAGQAVLRLAVDLFQSVAGLIFANFFILLILGGGYYLWTAREERRGGRRITK